jgi:hypothetical protein
MILFLLAHVFFAHVADEPAPVHPGSVKFICAVGVALYPAVTFDAVNFVDGVFLPVVGIAHDTLSLAIDQKSGQEFATGGNTAVDVFLFDICIPMYVNIKIKIAVAMANTTV